MEAGSIRLPRQRKKEEPRKKRRRESRPADGAKRRHIHRWRDGGRLAPTPRQRKKEEPRFLRGSSFLVEAAGIEPASEKPLTELSPGAGHLLNFPGLAADARAA